MPHPSMHAINYFPPSFMHAMQSFTNMDQIHVDTAPSIYSDSILAAFETQKMGEDVDDPIRFMKRFVL
jgi:hypothetical protein